MIFTIILPLFILYKTHFLSLCPDNLKKTKIKMKPNQAYETITRPQSATQVHTEPCVAYGVVQAHH